MNLLPECEVEFVRTSPNAVLPTKAHDEGTWQDACYDLYYCGEKTVHLGPGARDQFSTGWLIGLPPHWEAQVRPRSGLAAKHGVTVINTPGTIDAPYRGPLNVLLINLGEEFHTIKPGDRIAQVKFERVRIVAVKEVKEFTFPDTSRGANGFGSSGV